VPRCGLAMAIALRDESAFTVVICAAIGLVSAAAAVYTLTKRMQLFERGLTVRSAYGERTVLYSDVVRFEWSATRVYVIGAYSHTSIVAKLVPESGRGIRLRFTTSGQD